MFSLSSVRKGRINYPFSKVGVYLSAVLCVISIILALLILAEDFISLIFYFAFTFFLAGIILILKIRFFSKMKSESLQNYSVKNAKDGQKWKIILLLFCFIIALITPTLLLTILPIESWFIGLDGFVSGISLSEVILFCYARGIFQRKE